MRDTLIQEKINQETQSKQYLTDKNQKEATLKGSKKEQEPTKKLLRAIELIFYYNQYKLKQIDITQYPIKSNQKSGNQLEESNQFDIQNAPTRNPRISVMINTNHQA